ncbi:PKD domain-containing protein, partial [Chloroflexota bacterium]
SLDPATFNDLGTLDTHTAIIDWGEGTVTNGIITESPFGPPGSTAGADGTIDGSHVYGDNGTYTVTITLTDDDGGVVIDTLTVTVNNVDPVITLDTLEAIAFNGGDAFLGRIGVEQTHGVSAIDVGSDDLTFVWTFEPDVTTYTNTYFNNGSSADPVKSPHGTFPFEADDSANVTFTQPGIYTVTVTVTDDDGGSDTASLTILVTDDYEYTKSQGFWSHQFSGKGNQHIDDATLLLYLDIVNYVSGVFSEDVAMNDLADAWNVMQPGGPEVGDPHNSNMKGKATKQGLAAWLNFAAGGVLWDEIVPSGQPFNEAMAQVEGIRLNPDSTHEDYVQANWIAEAINTMDECSGNPESNENGECEGNTDNSDDADNNAGDNDSNGEDDDDDDNGNGNGNGNGNANGKEKNEDKGNGKGKK